MSLESVFGLLTSLDTLVFRSFSILFFVESDNSLQVVFDNKLIEVFTLCTVFPIHCVGSKVTILLPLILMFLSPACLLLFNSSLNILFCSLSFAV